MAEDADLAKVLQALVLHPGDTLIIRVGSITTRQTAEMMDELRRALPDNKALVVNAEELAALRLEREATAIADAVAEATAHPGRTVEVKAE